MREVLTGAGAIFCAAHHSRDGVLHGHTWEVVGWWMGMPDALKKQDELSRYLQTFDHSLLSESVAWAEDLAKRIAEDLGCVSVEIRRPLERLYANVSARKDTPQ